MSPCRVQPLIVSFLQASLICLFVGCNSSRPRPVPTQDDYFRLANEIASELIALREQIPYFAEIELDVDQEEALQKFRFHVFCVHGQTGTRPNPGWTPTAKMPRTIPVFSQDGLRLSVNLFVGSYMWARPMPQESIGQLRINYFAEGPMQDNALNEVRRVVDRHRRAFIKHHKL
jgi:hypothetical protein